MSQIISDTEKIMANSMKIVFLGGDRRQISAAQALASQGYDISVCAMPDGALCDGLECKSDIKSALADSSAVVLPLPASRDGVYLNTQCSEYSGFKLANIINFAPTSSLIIGGKLPSVFSAGAIERGFSVRDYLECESFQVKNAYTTAEAALSIAMNSLAKNIRDAKIAVTGYGRISKQLVSLLLDMKANVSVCARKKSDLAFAKSCGADVVDISRVGEIDRLLRGYDVIYNTVPSWIFDRSFLEKLDKNTLIIELASAPGGIDICAAKELSSNVSWALSLPGKYAPDSAGKHIAECVVEFITGEAEK